MHLKVEKFALTMMNLAFKNDEISINRRGGTTWEDNPVRLFRQMVMLN